MVTQARLEPMNASPYHSKVRVSLKLAGPLCAAGGTIAGKMELECKADTGLGIGVIMVELFAIEELTSRDHSATSTFLHSRRLFQGTGLPPSNAVHPYSNPGDPSLPSHYYPARRGMTTFLFQLPLPLSSPSAINFGSGLARIRYEVRGIVAVAWKGENKLVFDKKEVDVVESWEEDFERIEPEGVIVGESGKVWVQGKLIGGIMVAGQPACIELQVKNHSLKKNTGLSVSLTRELCLSSQPSSQKQPLQISDTLTSVSFRGPEYIIYPGAEGVANLVFDLPKDARGVKGGRRQGDEEEGRSAESLFEIRCIVNIKLAMGIGSKDIQLSIPVTVLHPLALPTFPVTSLYASPAQLPQSLVHDPLSAAVSQPHTSLTPYMTSPVNTFAYQEMLMTPQSMPYVDQAHVWLPPPHPASPPISASSPYQTHSPSPMPHLYYFPPAPQLMTSPYTLPARPSSAEPVSSQLLSLYSLPPGLPASGQQPLPPLCAVSQYAAEREEGKGERASRISLHLRMSSRHRSASPPAHRYPTSVASEPHASVAPLSAPTTVTMSSMPQERTNISPSSSSHTFHRTVSLNLPVSPAHSQGSVISPRPMLSPKHSFSNDPFSQISQVEQLERIAARVENEHPDMSLSKAELDFNVDLSHKKEKSLPAVPVPAASSARADVGALLSNPELLVDQTPPTPTLAAVTSLKVPRASADPSVCGGASGLDALEAKLLAEVGTQKVEKNEGRTDVRAVLPIPIPRVNDGVDPANDSAISSLTLPGLGSQGKTLKLEQAIHGDDDEDDDRALTEGREHRKNSKDSKKVASSISRFSKDKVQHSGKCSGERAVTGKTDEVHRLRKTARGRVTAWLGSIEPDVPPQSGTPPSSSPTAIVADLTDLPREDAHGRVAAWLNGIGRDTKPQPNMSPSIAMKDALLETAKPTQVDVATYGPPATDQPSEDPVDSPVTDVSAAPHPRSSGFVPIGTLRANKLKEPVAIGKVEVRDSENNPQLISTKQGPPSFPRLAVGSPRSDSPEVRYDIRSARGGRGGKVTAAAAIWASAAQQSEKVDVTKLKHVSAKRLDVALLQPTRSPPSESPVHSKSPISSDRSSVPVGPPAKSAKTSGSTTPTQLDVIPFSATDLTAKRARMIKSTSVPAIISSSLATPMLSSTASLARPSPPLIDRDKANHRLSPAVSEGQPSLNAKSTTAKPPPIKGDLAFGQARLRELIKRYQGQANS